jgi:hypothetical protein
MSRASDWIKVKQNDIRRQVIRAERDQRLHDAEYSPHPDDPPPVNWTLERWRARMAKKYRLAQQSTPAAPRPRPRRHRNRSPPYVSLPPVVIGPSQIVGNLVHSAVHQFRVILPPH